MSTIRDESSFEIAVDDIRPSRLKVTSEELLKNSIDRFDAFGDYEYIGNYMIYYKNLIIDMNSKYEFKLLFLRFHHYLYN